MEDFKMDARAAFEQLAREFKAIGRQPDGAPCFPADDEVAKALTRAAASRCGALVSAAVKRAKRRLVIEGLASARAAGHDVTPTKAKQSAQRLLGRGLDDRELLSVFGTPGRDAHDKSAVTAEDLAVFESRMRVDLEELVKLMDLEKERAAREWRGSARRLQILSDWAEQRAAMGRGPFRPGR